MDLKQQQVQIRADIYSLHQERQRLVEYVTQIDREVALKEGELRLIEQMLVEQKATSVESSALATSDESQGDSPA